MRLEFIRPCESAFPIFSKDYQYKNSEKKKTRYLLENRVLKLLF